MTTNEVKVVEDVVEAGTEVAEVAAKGSRLHGKWGIVIATGLTILAGIGTFLGIKKHQKNKAAKANAVPVEATPNTTEQKSE